VGGLARFATKDAQRQSARYDGLLQGTEVGMTLFYTDLLAKLWALDYHESSPTYAQVANFIPLLRTPVNAAYLPEVESLPGTRVWFGPDDNGFQKVSQPTTGVRFAARTTRIYAASSNPTEPGKESQPNAPSAQFLGWWHDHYEAVAAYEPQYQRLDEIMKWSVAISYLSGQSAIDSVDYLKNVHVGTGQWFPCWTAQHPELKFSNWKTIEFFDKRCSAAERDFPTETMPTLASKSYHGWTLSGGVSLASREGLLDRPAMSLNIPEELRRTGIDFSGSDGSLIRTLGKVEYSLGDATSDLATTTIKAPPAAHFRDVTSELRPAEVATRFERNGNVLSTLTKVGDAEVASVTFARRSDELVVALTRRDAARATELLADVNAEAVPENIAEWLSRRSDVATTIPIDERTALVRLNGADQWMKIVRETKPSIDIASDVVMRGGQVGTGATGDWTIAFVDRQTIDHVLDGGDFVLVRVANDPAQGVVIEEVAHGPPADAQTVTSGKISGKRSGNDIYVRRADLGGQADPAVLRRFAKQVDVDSALAYAQEGRYDKFAAEVAQNPEQYKREIANMAGSLDRGIDASLRNGDGRGALVLIARRTPYGGDPAKLAIRRAVAAAIVEKPGAAARALNDVALTPQLADESMTMAKAVLARDDLSDGARDSLERLATFIDYKRMAARSGTVVTATAESGGVDFLAEVRDLRVKRVATINPLAAGDAYVGADVPAAAIRHQTTAQGVDQIAYDPNVVEAFAVEDRALVLAHPAAIFDSKTGHRYQMAVRQAAVRTVPPNGRTYRTFVERCPPTAAGSPMPPDCRDPVYVLRPRQGMAVSVGP
jgi:hypothetical protein